MSILMELWLVGGLLLFVIGGPAPAMERAPAEIYDLSATLCTTPERENCTTASWIASPRPGDSEPYCDGAGPINRVVEGALAYLPGRRVFLAPETITCRRAP